MMVMRWNLRDETVIKFQIKINNKNQMVKTTTWKFGNWNANKENVVCCWIGSRYFFSVAE